MLVLYSNELKISLDQAKAAVIKTYPELESEIQSISTPMDLEVFLGDRGFMVYIDIDPSDDQAVYLAEEAKIKADVDARLNECPDKDQVKPMVFIESDLDEWCAPLPDTTIPEIDLTALEENIRAQIRAQDGGLSEGLSLDDVDANSPIGKIMGCLGEIKKITAEHRLLIDKEMNIRETLVNFEELLYNYRIMKTYYTTKLNTLESIINKFTPLLREQRHIEDIDIPEVEEQLITEKALLADYIDTIDGDLGGAVPDRPTTKETEYLEKIQQLKDEKIALEERKQELIDQIKLEKDSTWSFDMEQLQETHLNSGFNNKKEQLALELAKLMPGDISAFSSNVTLDTVSINTTVPDRSNTVQQDLINGYFALKIRHENKDKQHILDGRDLSFATKGKSQMLTIENFLVTPKPSGILYTELYNIWGYTEQYFNREERGLNIDKNMMDPTLQNTGAGEFSGNYIQNLSKFEDFYTNFDTYHTKKTNDVKANKIEPALSAVQLSMRDMATKEVQLLLSYGKVFEVLPEDTDLIDENNNSLNETNWPTQHEFDTTGSRLSGLENSIRLSSNVYLKKLDQCKATYVYILEQHKQVLKEIDNKQLAYSQVSCNSGMTPGVPMKEAGSDPLGKTTMGKEDPNDPNFTKFCYWTKFAKYATAVNVLPIGLKYWPIGLVIPATPPVKIPLPIVWIPLTVIALPVGVFVMFIAMAGIMPSPMLLFIGATGEKMFIVSLRPTQQFGADASDGTLKLLSKGGIAMNLAINDLLAGLPLVPGFGINLPDFNLNLFPDDNSTLISDAKDKITKKINKLKLPDGSKLNKLNPNASIEEKKTAFKEIVGDWLDEVKIPSLKFPKNSKGINPKPGAVLEMMDQLKFAIDMDLPNIIPPIEMIDVKEKFMTNIGGIKLPELNLPTITVPPLDDPAKVNEFVEKVKGSLKKIAMAAVDNITPKSLGILATFSEPPNFLNPYQCRQTGGGLKMPSLGPLTTVLATIRAVAGSMVDSLDNDTIIDTLLKGGTLAVVNPYSLTGMLKNLADTAIPDLKIPNLSNVSIKDMAQNAMTAIGTISLPKLPAPGPIQLRVVIPGSILKNAIKSATMSTLDSSLDIASLPDFSIISPIDIKQIAIGFVESSFAPVETAMQPFLTTISIAKALSNMDKGFGESLGLSKVTLDPLKVSICPELPLLAAIKILEALPPSPYPAVCAAPEVYKLVHPILSQDDLPPWDRLSLSNPLFVIFLDQFCRAGKVGSGFFENP